MIFKWVRFLLSNYTFRKKLLLSYFFISIVPLLLTSTFSFFISINTITKMKRDMAMNSFNYNIEKTLNVKEQVEKLSMDIFCNDYIQNNICMSNNQISNVAFSNAIKENLKSITNNAPYINYIGIFTKSGNAYRSNWSYDELFTDYDGCRSYMASNDINYLNKWFKPQKNLYYGSLRDKYAVFYFQVLRNISTFQEIGVLVVAVKRNSLLTTYDIDNKNTFIIDGDGNIIASANDDSSIDYSKIGLFEHIENIRLPKGSYRAEIEDEDYLIFYSKISDNSWYIFSLVPYSVILSDSIRIGIVTALILSVFIFLAVVFSILVTKNLISPIMRLYQLMDRVKEGDLTVRFEKTNNDEIGRLGDNFNKMIETLDIYLDEIYKQQQAMKTSQMSLMQAQVNPHMLYNTLDSLQYYINHGNNKKANEILYAISKFFRISLSHGDVLISIRNELMHVLSYIDIQKNCYNVKVDCNIDIPEDLMEKMIIKMTLQPIVENCILHGFKNFIDVGKIQMHAEKDMNDGILFTVTDNGMGIMQDQLTLLNDFLDSEEDTADIDKPFGIINVNRRIKHFFGQRYGIRIESEFGVYTRVIITFPGSFSVM